MPAETTCCHAPTPLAAPQPLDNLVIDPMDDGGEVTGRWALAPPPQMMMIDALPSAYLERTADVRFGAHNGLQSGIAPCPLSAETGS